MRNLLHALLVLTLLVAPRAGAARDERGADPGVAAASLHWREDAILVRLSAAATRALPARPGAFATHTRALGLPALDAVAAALGGATFEREFPPAPATGSPRLADLATRAADDRLAAFHVVHLPPGVTRDAALAAFRGADGVESAEAIALAPVEALPNDSLWAAAWGFWQPSRRDIHAPEAWDVCRGDTAIVVGIVDTGVLLHHPDLREQVWTNAAEAAGAPGVDDDHNGYVDDVHGWDFVALSFASEVVAGEDWRDEDNDPDDFTAHGTAAAGLVGARTNNGVGVAGTAWDVRLMPLRAGYSSSVAPSGWVDLSFAARAIVYGARNGASVLNLSFASSAQADLGAACDEATRLGATLVAAAGNGQPEHYLPERGDVIGVTALDDQDRLPVWANRGDYVTLAAPGVNLPSTLLARFGTDSLGLRTPSYTTFATGTSFSAPLASGAAALLQARRRAQGLRPLTPFEVQLRLAETADDIAAQNPGTSGWGAGRLNLLRALTDPPGSFAVPLASRTVGPGVRLPTFAPPARLAYATADGHLLLADAAPEGRVLLMPLSGTPQGGIAAADMGGGLGTALFVATRAGTIDGFDANGRPLPGWPVPASVLTPGQYEPALADLDGNGRLEVIWGGGDGTVRAWHADGSVVAGFPRVLVTRSADLFVGAADLDGQPGAEIAVTSGTNGIWLLRGDGTVMPGWPRDGLLGAMPPVIARVGFPPRPSVVVAGAYTIMGYDVAGNQSYGRSPSGYQMLPLAAADPDGDGRDELLVVRASPDSAFVLHASGAVLRRWALPVIVTPSPTGASLYAPLASQGRTAVVMRATSGELCAYTDSGVVLPGFPKPGLAGAAPAIEDLDGDGSSEIVAGSGADGALYVYRTLPDNAPRGARGWYTTRGNSARTGATYGAAELAQVDNAPPARVADLAAAALDAHRAVLTWTAPADVGPSGRAAHYDVRWSRAPIDESNVALATPVAGAPLPGVSGAAESFTATGLPEQASLWLALRAVDAAGNVGPLSNVVTVATGVSPPAGVTDLRLVAWTDTSAVLAWTATGDDGASGRPARYRLRAATVPLDAGSFAAAPFGVDLAASTDAGGTERGEIRGLAQGTRYWFALIADDPSGAASPLSNEASAVLGPLAARAGLALAPRQRPSGVPVELFWQRDAGDAAPREVRLHDLAGRLVRALPVGGGTEGRVTWDGRDRDGARVRPGLYFATLAAGGRTVTTRVVLVE